MSGNHANNQEFLNSLVDLILADIGNQNFGARELADAAGMKQRRLSQKLRSVKGISVSRFICETRLKKALELLQTENLTVSEVGYKVGFGSPTYFNKCFHEFFGYPPGKIRKDEADDPGKLITDRKWSKYLTGKTFSQKVIRMIAGLLALAGFFLMINSVYFKKSSNNDSAIGSKKHEISLAVLPFKNLSDSTANQYFIDGVMDEILINLSRIHDLRVVSLSSVEQFRESKMTTSEIGKRLNVEYLVEASCQKYGNTFRLRVQLLYASSDTQVWARSFEQEIIEVQDIFKIQSQIAQSIAAALKASITTEEGQIIEKIPTSNLTAYDFYQRGKDELGKYQWPEFNLEAVRRAEILFHNALEYDSTFARAYAGLAEVLWIKLDRDLTITNSNILNNYLDSMLILSNIALKYDIQLAEAYFVRGGYYDNKGLTGKAFGEWDKAIKYNSNYYQAYVAKGSRDEDVDICKSLEDFNKAASLNRGRELPMILTRIGHNYYMAGFPEKGKYYIHLALKLDGDSVKYFKNVNDHETERNGEFIRGIEYYNKRYLTDSTNASLLIHLGYFNSLIGDYQGSLKYYKKYLSVLKVSPYYNQWAKMMMEYFIGYAFMENGYTKESDYYLTDQLRVIQNISILIGLQVSDIIYIVLPAYMPTGEKNAQHMNT